LARRSDAYILIGVEEVKGGRCNVIGVINHFDDASIQQFVNSKTNHPLNFSYQVSPFEGNLAGNFWFRFTYLTDVAHVVMPGDLLPWVGKWGLRDQEKENIRDLYDILSAAGVPTVDHRTYGL